MKTRRPTEPPKGAWNYRQLWKIVDGAVADAFNCHTDYVNPSRRERVVRNSINKRIVGAVIGYASQARGADPKGG